MGSRVKKALNMGESFSYPIITPLIATHEPPSFGFQTVRRVFGAWGLRRAFKLHDPKHAWRIVGSYEWDFKYDHYNPKP